MSLFTRIPGTNITLVGDSSSAANRVSQMLTRIMFFRTRKSGRCQMVSPFIAGTVAKGRKGWRIYISQPVMACSDITFSQIVAHERFHTFPVIGLSEIAAHFFGGLHRRPGKHSWKYAIHEVLALAILRPLRFWAEITLLAAILTLLLIP